MPARTEGRSSALSPENSMNYLDLKYGTLYAILNIASVVYLLWGFKIRLRQLLKAMMAIQLLGDLLFFDFLLDYSVFPFIKTLTAEDRVVPVLILMGCVLAVDLGANLVSTWSRQRAMARVTTLAPRETGAGTRERSGSRNNGGV